MQTRVEKVKLLAKVKENRAAHRAIFEEAVVGYREQAVKLLEDHIARIKAGKVVMVHVVLPTPEDHTKDYDRVIGMVEMSMMEHIELDEMEFSNFVLDDWAWKRQFLHSNSTYSATAMRTLQDGA